MIPTIPRFDRAAPRAIPRTAAAPAGRRSAAPAAPSARPPVTAGRPALRSVVATATLLVLLLLPSAGAVGQASAGPAGDLVTAAERAPQESVLQSGPMLGYSEMTAVLLWAQTTRPAEVRFRYWDLDTPERTHTTAPVRTEAATGHVAKAVADDVEPGRRYGYEILVDGEVVERPYPLEFRTRTLWQWRTDPPPFTIALASCFYVNEPRYDRPGEPYGGDYQILGHLYDHDPDAMVWLGDNTYLREADWNTWTGILHRHTHTRSLPELQPLLASVHHYATWDDHDYGPNNADRSWFNKERTRDAFELFWGNLVYGVHGAEGGITSSFEWEDVQFFLMDDRWWRAPNDRVTGERDYLGEGQIEWLVDALSSSFAPFKFVVVGGQVLNPVARYENYSNYAAERQRLLDRIRAEDIPGVVFLTGDRHHTELTRMERRGTYPLYDLTISPLTAGPNPGAADEPNHMRVEGTFVGDRNFALLEVAGPRTDRVLTIRVVDKDGVERWSRQIAASELR